VVEARLMSREDVSRELEPARLSGVEASPATSSVPIIE
jgi:aspartate ammonia-lyase